MTIRNEPNGISVLKLAWVEFLCVLLSAEKLLGARSKIQIFLAFVIQRLHRCANKSVPAKKGCARVLQRGARILRRGARVLQKGISAVPYVN